MRKQEAHGKQYAHIYLKWEGKGGYCETCEHRGNCQLMEAMTMEAQKGMEAARRAVKLPDTARVQMVMKCGCVEFYKEREND